MATNPDYFLTKKIKLGVQEALPVYGKFNKNHFIIYHFGERGKNLSEVKSEFVFFYKSVDDTKKQSLSNSLVRRCGRTLECEVSQKYVQLPVVNLWE